MKFMKKLLLFLFVSFFLVNRSFSQNIVITEIMYNNPASDSLEFVEIYNNGSSTVDLEGWKFSKAFKKTIHATLIAPGQYKVYCVDSMAFYRAFGMSANQWGSGSLSNGGDSVYLVNGLGVMQDLVVYNNSFPWPEVADGEGPSLALCNPSSDNSIASNWSSAQKYTGIFIEEKEIYAHPGLGCPSTDAVGPVPFKAWTTAANKVQIAFNESLNSSADVVSHYTGLGTIFSAIRSSSNDTVTLTLATPLSIGMYSTITIDNIEDITANAMTAPRSFDLVFNNTLGSIAMDEIYYNDPYSLLKDTIEFIEITNYGNMPVSLGGYKFNQGLSFKFPERTLAPGAFLVISEDSVLMQTVFGLATLQWSSGGLGNTTDTLVLTNSLEQTIDSVYYASATPYDVNANGNGPSLVMCPPYNYALPTNNDIASSWHAEVNRTDFLNVKSFNGYNLIVSPGRANCDPLSIDEGNDLNSFSLYPNPTTQDFIVEKSNNNPFEYIEIYDMLGTKLLKKDFYNQKSFITLRDYSNGVYSVVLKDTDNKTISIKKLIKN